MQNERHPSERNRVGRSRSWRGATHEIPAADCAGRGCGATARRSHGRKSGESARTPAIVIPSERQLAIEAMLSYRDIGFAHQDRYVSRGARQHRAEGPGAEYVARISIDRTRMQVEDKLVKGHGGDGQGQDRRAGSSGTSLAAFDIQAGIAAEAIKSRLLQACALYGAFPREVSARSRADTHAGAAGNMLPCAWTSRSQRKRRTSTPRSDRSSDGSRFRTPRLLVERYRGTSPVVHGLVK